MLTFLNAINAQVPDSATLIDNAASKVKEWLSSELSQLATNTDAVEGILGFLSDVPTMTDDPVYNQDIVESECSVYEGLNYNTNGFLTFETSALPTEILDGVRVGLLHAGDNFWADKVGAIPFVVKDGDDVIVDTVFTVSWASMVGEDEVGILLHEGTGKVEV